MSLDNAISMEPVKEKLRNLHEYLPNENSILYDFAGYLADRLNPRLVPEGFVLAAELALYDLQTGIDGFTQQPVPARLQGYPSVLYAVLQMRVPEIAAAACPDDFGQDVAKVYAAIAAK